VRNRKLVDDQIKDLFFLAAYSQIDWHDFVVVETVDYQPQEQGNFPVSNFEILSIEISFFFFFAASNNTRNGWCTNASSRTS
jgi:hypothetical protein